ASRLHDPGGQAGKIVRHAPASRRGALVEPGELRETVPFVIDEVFEFVAFSRFQNNDIDAFLGQFVAERAAASARADDDDDLVVLEIIWSSHCFLPMLSRFRKQGACRTGMPLCNWCIFSAGALTAIRYRRSRAGCSRPW